MNKHLYHLSNILYGLSGLLGLFFFFKGFDTYNWLLIGIGVAVVYVAVDNILCQDRKHRYLGHTEKKPADTKVTRKRVTKKRKKKKK